MKSNLDDNLAASPCEAQESRGLCPRTDLRKVMILRILLIGLSACILLGTMCIAAYGWSVEFMLDSLVCFGYPLVISIIISVGSKSPDSQKILLGTTLLYGFLLIGGIDYTFHSKSTLQLYFAGTIYLPVLIPLWVFAIVVETRYNKKQAEP